MVGQVARVRWSCGRCCSGDAHNDKNKKLIIAGVVNIDMQGNVRDCLLSSLDILKVSP